MNDLTSDQIRELLKNINKLDILDLPDDILILIAENISISDYLNLQSSHPELYKILKNVRSKKYTYKSDVRCYNIMKRDDIFLVENKETYDDQELLKILGSFEIFTLKNNPNFNVLKPEISLNIDQHNYYDIGNNNKVVIRDILNKKVNYIYRFLNNCNKHYITDNVFNLINVKNFRMKDTLEDEDFCYNFGELLKKKKIYNKLLGKTMNIYYHYEQINDMDYYNDHEMIIFDNRIIIYLYRSIKGDTIKSYKIGKSFRVEFISFENYLLKLIVYYNKDDKITVIYTTQNNLELYENKYVKYENYMIDIINKNIKMIDKYDSDFTINIDKFKKLGNLIVMGG